MRGASRRLGVAVLAALSIAVAAAALAWACTPQASITIHPGTGLPGSTAIVTGNGFPPVPADGEPAPVEIRWGGRSGPVIGETSGQEFSVPVTIPATATAGVHYIVAIVSDPRSGETYLSTTSFKVTAAEAPTAPANPTPPAGRGSPSGEDAPSQRDRAGAVSPGRATPGRTTAPGRRSPAPTTRGRPRVDDESGAVRRVPDGVRRGAVGSGPSSRTGAAVTADSGRVVFGGSAGPARPSPADRRADPAVRPGERATPDGTLALGDLSRGFASPTEALLVPSVTSRAASGPSPGAQLTVGMILLGTGLVALFGGALVAGLRRRRARTAGDRQTY